MDIFSWINRIDWGLTIAFISLIFTAFVSFITIRYTKRSLEYTKRSMQIASSSLQATQKSIETSIDIYEKQKKDDDNKINYNNETTLKLMKSHISEEIKINYTHSKGLMLLFQFASSKQNIEMEIVDVYSDLRMVMIKADGEEKGFVYANPDINFIDKYLYQLMKLDRNIAEIAMKLKISNLIYVHKMNFLFLYIKNKLILSEHLHEEIQQSLEVMNSYNLLLEKLYDACASEGSSELKQYIINPLDNLS